MKQTWKASYPIAELEPHPDNPRRGDVEAIGESIDAHGFYGAVLVQESRKRIIAGEHRWRAAQAKGMTKLPVVLLDCTDDEAKRIMLADNRTPDLAYYDDQALFKLLGELDGDYSGTGYDQTSYDMLLRAIDSPGSVGDVAQGFMPEEREAGYLAADIRSIVLPYHGEQFDVVAEGLKQLRAAFNVDTNAEVVAILVADATE